MNLHVLILELKVYNQPRLPVLVSAAVSTREVPPASADAETSKVIKPGRVHSCCAARRHLKRLDHPRPHDPLARVVEKLDWASDVSGWTVSGPDAAGPTRRTILWDELYHQVKK